VLGGAVAVIVAVVLMIVAGHLLWQSGTAGRAGAGTSVASQDSSRTTLAGDSNESVATSIYSPPKTSPGSSVPASSTSSSSSSSSTSSTHPPHAPLSLYFNGSRSKREVALTFDDGPSAFTPQIMAVLEKARVPATFFCIGSEAAADPAAVAALRGAGFEVENHSWDHPKLTRLSPEAIAGEISRTDQVLGGATYLRPPYGSYNTAVWDAAHSLGLQIVLWNVDTLDWKYRNAGSILYHLKSEVRPGSIILMHDGGGNRSATVAALPQVIAWLKSQGYALETVKQLLVGATPSLRPAQPDSAGGE
jgi:peptidoglycan-N-acetylglucosamine deacetylase